MLDTLTGADITAAFTPTSNTDIKVIGTFFGRVRLESQLPGQTTWEPVPGSDLECPGQFTLTVNSADVDYRFRSFLESGSAIVYASGV